MQILGKRSKVLLIVIAIVMLLALGVSFAIWDTSAVNATNGNLSNYANAKVGDIIEFGRYYQTGEKVSNAEDAEYKKTPIEWIVVDKDERTGQLTLMSKYILACGSYFGNYYSIDGKTYDWNYSGGTKEIYDIPYNQAYVDSTARAFLNNLERLDMGGDEFVSGIGYLPSNKNSTIATGLLSSVGFSNQKYWTGLKYNTDADKKLADAGNNGLIKRIDSTTEIFYQRPINNIEYKNRPATLGFYDEAFSDAEKLMILPKPIAGYTGHRWPDSTHDVSTKSYVEGAADKVWLPSASELNITQGKDWNEENNAKWTNPSDEIGSNGFEYVVNYSKYVNPITETPNSTVEDALATERTVLAKDGKIGNYSIPVYDKGTITPKTLISNIEHINSTDYYWTRSPSSYWHTAVIVVEENTFRFNYNHTYYSNVGVRPCVILKY